MLLKVKKALIEGAIVSAVDLDYMPGIAIDESLMEAAGLLEGECVNLMNTSTGQQWTSHVLKAPRDSGMIGINGPGSHGIKAGQRINIVAYCWVSDEEYRLFSSTNVFPNEDNRLS